MTKFNANKSELYDRISTAVKESRAKKLTGEKQVDYIVARVWQLGEIGYSEYQAARAAKYAANAADARGVKLDAAAVDAFYGRETAPKKGGKKTAATAEKATKKPSTPRKPKSKADTKAAAEKADSGENKA